MATVTKKSVLITGCSTGGIGWAMAKTFHERGFYVFATARDVSRTGILTDLENIEILELDVTIPKTISQCKERVTKRTGGRLDVLVNNAGVEFNSPLLDTDIDEAKKLFDVNVWGPLAMVQAFAPLLVEAKGVVFNQSSIDGALNMVWAGKLSMLASCDFFLIRTLTHITICVLLSRHLCKFQIRGRTHVRNSTCRTRTTRRSRRDIHMRICRHTYVR